MGHILAVGVATLDIVNEVERYPGEDDEVRALSQSVQRGGNSTNTLVVLSQFGHKCEWAGVLADEPNAAVILEDLQQHGVGAGYCCRTQAGRLPTSFITLSRATASRTIVHYRDLPEFGFESFVSIPLQEFDWVHFEARNVTQTQAMMRFLREHHPDCPVSLEVEKPRPRFRELLPWADLILTTGLVAEHEGFAPEALLHDMHEHVPAADIVCTLGVQGAVALDSGGRLVRSSAFPPSQLVDTLGAGDTFNAAMIDSRLRHAGLEESLRFACRMAGRKCGQKGLAGLVVTTRARNLQPLCDVCVLPEGASRGFNISTPTGDEAVFLVHRHGRIVAYRNSCPHTGAPLDWVPDRFLNLDGDLIQCANHDALFRIEDGLCIAGPCNGKRLSRIEILVDDGVVYADVGSIPQDG